MLCRRLLKLHGHIKLLSSGGARDQTNWLAEACKTLLLLHVCLHSCLSLAGEVAAAQGLIKARRRSQKGPSKKHQTKHDSGMLGSQETD